MPRLDKSIENVRDLRKRLGGIPLQRIRLHPPPGAATEKDVLAAERLPQKRLCELVDGVLVEKVMGYPESYLAVELSRILGNYLAEHDLGVLTGADGFMRLMPGLVRIPDLAFVAWDRLPVRGRIPDEPIAARAPDLAVEVISKGNTRGEMTRKLREYFLAGVKQVWYVHPQSRRVDVYTGPGKCVVVMEGQTLDGGDLLPGFKLPLKQLFARVSHAGDAPKGKKPRRKDAEDT